MKTEFGKDIPFDGVRNLGLQKNIEVVSEFVTLANKSVIDAGCGSLVFTEQLAEAGASVLAIDPDPLQAQLNREKQLPANIRFVETGADRLPVDDHSVDGVFFSYSLHHIPAEFYPQVFQEVGRVLKPDGFLYVIEPIDCPWNQVMMLFHNEEIERAAAQQALCEIAKPMFQTLDVVVYHSITHYESFDQFANQFGSRTFNPGYSIDDVRAPEVQQAFETLASDPQFTFIAPKVVVVMQRLRESG